MKNLGWCMALVALLLGGCRRRVERIEWPVMGTVAAFQYRDAADAAKAGAVREVFAEVERLLNAHDPESELRRLAPLDDAAILARCAPPVRPCYAAAFAFRDATGGVFNPRWRGPGTMDLGAIAKGFAVDLAARRVGPCDALIDLGGNLKALGGAWRVGIQGGGDVLTLRAGEACATSGEYYRGRHIKDGRTGGDIATAAHSVTVVHPDSAMLADALSTTLFILGKERGDEFLARAGHGESRVIWVR